MIEFAKITGETENNYIQIQLRTGECLYAPLVVMGTGVTLPSEKWIQRNKNNFLALVTYEKDMYISPMVIGFYPVKGAESETYNSVEKLILIVKKLVEQLSKAKVNTQLGPQQFMPDTLLVMDELTSDLSTIIDDINSISL